LSWPQVVPDVHKFPGHIACDSETNSEIVVPIMTGDKVWGVLDIVRHFDSSASACLKFDRIYLSMIVLGFFGFGIIH
jgi:L-methionine (R)-S-oxide reductase